mmetsp:Transcript_15369/g.23138  ORF Transcript_15369/g.23138 Transcript_15369/m.23138 type:complete len:861 (-) Transcript_15369:165-2747(-)
MSKLRFSVVNCSSEHEDYPAIELNIHSPSTKGWQSRNFCDYPQELGFRMEGGDTHITQIQILSHQSKISTKIEIFVGQGNDYHSATYKRLGYLSLDSNERSNYRARELKTVYVDHVGNFVRLLIHRNFVNKYNHYNQVGLVAVNFLGTEQPPVAGGKGITDGRQMAKGAKSVPSNSLHDLSIDLNLDQGTAAKLRRLADAKARAVSQEDYKTAKTIKTVEGELKALGSRLAQLDIAKRQAVNAEDYDRAAALKDETDALRQEIEDKIEGIHIAGVTDRPIETVVSSPFRADDSPPKASPRSPRGNHPMASARSVRSLQSDHKAPLDVDSMVVGGGGGGYPEYGGARRDETPRDYGHDQGFESEEERDTRPIRPKANVNYNDRDPEVDPIGVDEEDGVGNNFPPGQHPLEGVSNLSELPVPEELHGVNKDAADSSGMTALLGEYRASCIFSKVWALREAGVHKTRMMLREELYNQPGISSCLNVMCAVVKPGLTDKIAQVFVASMALLDDIIVRLNKDQVPRSVAAPAMEPILSSLIEKLNDGASRIREASRQMIESFASCPAIGPALVANHVLRPLPAKQKNAWRPILGRLQLLGDLVGVYGVGGSSGLTTESVMNYIKSMNAFSHSNGEVRDAAKFVTVALHKYVGLEPLEPYLTLLRKKQLEEYQLAFSSHSAGAGSAFGDGTEATSGEEKQRVPAENKSKGSAQNAHNTPVKPTAMEESKSAVKDEAPPGDNDFTLCMFCGKSDKSWNEDGLDLHYWKECPLLSPCSACAQIVEIAGLPEHLLDECEQKDTFVACDTTGLAIRKDEMEAWKSSASCVPPPDNCMYCPLCLASVEDTDDAWRQHLLYGCPKNGRSYAA